MRNSKLKNIEFLEYLRNKVVELMNENREKEAFELIDNNLKILSKCS